MKQHGGTAWRARMITLAILVGAMGLAPEVARAATLFVAPSAGQYAVGQTFDVVVKVNSQGTAINASEGVLSFNPAQLQVQSITLNGSIFNLNVQEPEYSNAAGTVRWTGVILNPGYTGSSGTLITVRFKGLVQGTTTVKYNSAAVLANDGKGTNVLSGMTGGTYTIGVVGTPATPVPTPAVTTSDAPVITSTTHPDSLQWYSNNDPVFAWNMPAGIDGVSYLINPKPDANPGNASDGIVAGATFTDIAEGATYLHVKFRRAGVWGPIAHFPFSVDTIAPEPFFIIREDAGDTRNPRPRVSYGTTDGGSGVVRYMMRIGDGEWFEVPTATEDEPFTLPLQAPGIHAVQVEAVDRAGNSTGAMIVVTVEPLTRPVIVEYPPTVDAGTAFSVGGTADSSVSVVVEAIRMSGPFGRLLYNDTPATTVTVKSDTAGRWSAAMGVLPNGSYRLQATSVDDRGARSYPSEPVTVKVGYGIAERIVDFFRGHFGDAGWFVWVLRFALLIALMMLVSALAHCGDWRFWVPLSDLSGEERKESSKLRELAADIEDELDILAKVSVHRPLYPEEKYLKSKLQQYRKTVAVLLRDPRSRLAKRK